MGNTPRLTPKRKQVLNYLIELYNDGDITCDITERCKRHGLTLNYNAVLSAEGMIDKRFTNGRQLVKWISIRPNIYTAIALIEKVKVYQREAQRRSNAKKSVTVSAVCPDAGISIDNSKPPSGIKPLLPKNPAEKQDSPKKKWWQRMFN